MTRSSLFCLGLATAASFAVGCASTPPPPPASASAPPVAQPVVPRGVTSAQPPSTVAISEDIRTRCGISDADAYFPFDSSRLTTTDHSPLDLVARCFASGPLAGHVVKLVGRADPRGASEYNMTLGQSRADAVGSYLDSHGVSSGLTSSTSRGSLDATGTDGPGWMHDRRVDVLLGN